MSGVTWEGKVRELRTIAVILIALAALPAILRAQNSGITKNQGPGQAVHPAATALRITAPKSGERLQQDFVNVQYELMNEGASAAGMPIFRVKLDSQEPVTTSTTNYTFIGLAPGPHTVTVQLVDANGTPITAAGSEVQFIAPQQLSSSQGGAAPALRHGLLEALHIRR